MQLLSHATICGIEWYPIIALVQNAKMINYFLPFLRPVTTVSPRAFCTAALGS